MLTGVLAIAVAGCTTAEQWGFPRVPVSARSPDGRHLAFVRNHPNIDPSDQSLWLQPAGRAATKLMSVPPDAWYCETILWAADSRRVAFVVSEAIVHVFEAETLNLVFSGFPGTRTWDTPPRRVLREPALTTDGSGMVFTECERAWVKAPPERQNRTGRKLEALLRGCGEAQVTVRFADVPASRLMAVNQ